MNKSEVYAAWKRINPTLRGSLNHDSFEKGWQAAMRAIWDRLPAPEYARDPMTPREVGKLLDYVQANLPLETTSVKKA